MQLFLYRLYSTESSNVWPSSIWKFSLKLPQNQVAWFTSRMYIKRHLMKITGWKKKKHVAILFSLIIGIQNSTKHLVQWIRNDFTFINHMRLMVKNTLNDREEGHWHIWAWINTGCIHCQWQVWIQGNYKNRKTWALRSLKLHRTIQIVIRYWRSLVPISTGTTHDRVPKRNCGINKGGPSLVSKDVVSNRLFCNMANHFKMSKITSWPAIRKCLRGIKLNSGIVYKVGAGAGYQRYHREGHIRHTIH